jgi:hypothetical protein
MSATPQQPATKDRPARPGLPVTHDVGLRISWNNRPEISIRPEAGDKKLGLPGANIPWQTRRENMKVVCANCHQQGWIDNFYVQYDSLVEQYHSKFAVPGKELYEAARPLMKPVQFSNELDWAWYELWHHEGRRARHGASMMGPDYTHWHGTYEVAKRFYTEMVPQLEKVIRTAKDSGDPKKAAAADQLHKKLEEVLNSPNHRWYVDKIDPDEREDRRRRQEEFRQRYSK